MSDPELTIITPSYNQGEFIEESILSVKNQRFDDLEHWIIDGGSTDQTKEILKEHESEYNLKWISEPDQGQSHAINKGIDNADGDWIAWLNSDDYYLPGALKKWKQGLKNNPETDIIYGDFIYVNLEGNKIRKKFHSKPSKFINKHYQFFTGNHCTFFRSNVFNKVGKIREDLEYTMDAELFWRLLNSDLDFTHIPSLIAARRLHTGAKTYGEKTEKNKKEAKELRKLYNYSKIEKIIPNKLLTLLAIGLHNIYLLEYGKWGAIKETYKQWIRKYILNNT